jgi:HK97 family phage major capsid protein
MPTYNTHIARNASGSDPLVPEPLATSIIQEAPTQSAALSLMNRTTMSTKTQRQPVLDVLPVAYWVGGDTGMKQTTLEQWKNVVLVVEELAVIVPIPEAYLDDADVPIWGQVQPRIVEAVGQMIDLAVLWGVNKPTTWGESVFVGATKSGNVIVEGANASTDLGQDVSNLGFMMAQTGYAVKGFAAQPGINWRLVGMRSAQGQPIYQPNMQGTPGGTLYGYPMQEIDNGSWNATNTGATLLAGDFSKAMIAIRKDISFKMFTEGVISDDSGKVILNLMQQDTVAMRMTMRLAYATVNPVTIMKAGVGITERWPFAALLPKGVTPPATGAIDVKQGIPYPFPGTYMAEGESTGPVVENEEVTPAMEAQQDGAEDVRALASGKEPTSPRSRGQRSREREGAQLPSQANQRGQGQERRNRDQ